jgi:hypothetical protein
MVMCAASLMLRFSSEKGLIKTIPVMFRPAPVAWGRSGRVLKANYLNRMYGSKYRDPDNNKLLMGAN